MADAAYFLYNIKIQMETHFVMYNFMKWVFGELFNLYFEWYDEGHFHMDMIC